MPEPIQNALLALAFLACGGLHIVLRLLSLHLCNEYPSLPKKKKKKKTASSVSLVYLLLLAFVCMFLGGSCPDASRAPSGVTLIGTYTSITPALAVYCASDAVLTRCCLHVCFRRCYQILKHSASFTHDLSLYVICPWVLPATWCQTAFQHIDHCLEPVSSNCLQ